MKATEQYFPVVLFIMLFNLVLPFEFVNEILRYNHSNESYRSVISCGTVYYAVQGALSPRVKSYTVTIQMKTTEQYFPLVLSIMPCKVLLFSPRKNPKVWLLK